MMVFVPTTPAQARALWQGEVLRQVQAFAVTPQLLDTLDMGPKDAEDAEYACLVLASVWGLATHGTRLVLVAQADDHLVEAGGESHNGGIRLTSLGKRQVESFFTDEDRQPLADAARTAVAGKDLDDAWEDDAVQQLVRRADLLWHSVEELAHLGSDGTAG